MSILSTLWALNKEFNEVEIAQPPVEIIVSKRIFHALQKELEDGREALWYCERCSEIHIGGLLIKLIEEQADEDPTPWCHVCGAMTQPNCHCGPIAESD